MDPINHADENELQQAIDSIANGSADPIAAPSPAVDTAAATADSVTAPTSTPDPAPVDTAVDPTDIAIPAPDLSATPSADGDLDKIKNMALSDLRPVLEQIDLPAESKFKLYKEIIESTSDKAAIEPAYTAAKAIASDQERAEALLYIIESIDKLSV